MKHKFWNAQKFISCGFYMCLQWEKNKVKTVGSNVGSIKKDKVAEALPRASDAQLELRWRVVQATILFQWDRKKEGKR